jgi:hypothetical protein
MKRAEELKGCGDGLEQSAAYGRAGTPLHNVKAFRVDGIPLPAVSEKL